jgi:hypothetical protein
MNKSIRRIFNRVVTAAILACYGSTLFATVYAACWDAETTWLGSRQQTCGSSIFTSCQHGDCIYYSASATCTLCYTRQGETPTGMKSNPEPLYLSYYKQLGVCQPTVIGCDTCDYVGAPTVPDPVGQNCQICNLEACPL